MRPILTPMGKQVILGYFVLAGGLFFNRHSIMRMFTGDYEVDWHGENHFHVPPMPGRMYLGAFDLGGNRARGRGKKGSDATVGMVIDYTERPWRIVYYEYIPGGDADWETKYEVMAKVFRDYGMPYLLIDATGQVDAVEEALIGRGVDVEGVQFGGNSSAKWNMLRSLQLALEWNWTQDRALWTPESSGLNGLIRSVPIPRVKGELDRYVYPDEAIVQDTVMTLAMLVHYILQNGELPFPVTGDVW